VGYDETIRLPDERLLSYLDEGDPEGTPLIFCHGSPSSRLAAVDLAPAVAERGGRLIAPDRPGLGRSEPEVGRSLASFAADVADLADALDLAGFRMLAVSGGGPYALATAWALPDRVERVALLSSPGSFDIPGAMDGMLWVERLKWLLARWQPRMLGWLLKQQLGATTKEPDTFTQRIVEGMRGEDRVALDALDPAQQRRFVADPLAEALRQDPVYGVEDMRVLRAPWGFGVQDIRVPVHLWHGTADNATPVAMGGWLAAMIPGVDAHILEGEGHVSTVLRYAEDALDVLLAD
jgi:pimeloyl-ACP methyl ester carboxylesterase